MGAIWASLPLLVALGCMAVRAGAVRAGALALLTAFVVAWGAFAAPIGGLAVAVADFAGVMLEVALILLGGLLLHATLDHTGSQRRLGEALIARTRSTEHAVVLVVLGIIPFAESVTGFGVGTLVGIPLLMAIGLPPRRAAICGVLG